MDPIVKRLFESKRLLEEEEKNTPDAMYTEYLVKHTSGVAEVFETVMLPILQEEGLSKGDIDEIYDIIEAHDVSKYGDEEFGPYRDYFYDKENHPRSSEAFNLAWLHHQNHNPHHWQYWCLINDVDEPQLQPMDIPFKYIVEMLCDWQSAGNHYGNTAYEWYEKQKDKMIFTDHTRKIVEKYIVHFK